VTKGEKEADRHWTLTFGHELSGGVINSGDVVSVKRVSHTERVGENSGADPERFTRTHPVVSTRGNKQ
jgi:hypothetical protein